MRKRFQKFDGLIHAALDICALILAGFLSEWMVGEATFTAYVGTHFEVIYLVFIFITLSYVFDLYYPLRNFRSYRAVIRLLVTITLFALIVYLIGTLRHALGHPPFHDATQLGWFVTLLLMFTYALRLGLSFLRVQVFVRNAIMIGDTVAARRLLQCIADEHHAAHPLGFHIIGYIAETPSAEAHADLPYLGTPSAIPKIRSRRNVTLMIYALDVHQNPRLDELLVRERLHGVHLISAIGLYQAISGRVPHDLIDAGWLIEECLRSNRFAQAHLKNLVDKTVSTLLALMGLPILIGAAILIKWTSPGPVLFTQRRIGRYGKPFTMYKLRSMRESDEEEVPGHAENWHHRQESRITTVGHFLRRTHIDELPQLFNVIRGDMSLVGPRPEMEIFIRSCEKEIPFYRLRLDVKPGITGWAQVAFRHTSSLEAYKQKFEYELYYLGHLSLQLDLEILTRTAFIVIFKRSR